MKLSLITKIVLVLIIGALIIIPQIALPNAEFSGADDQGGKAITAIDPNYKPWFDSLFQPGDMEENLFHFQQALGIGGLIVCFGYLNKKSKKIQKLDKSL
ncbi:MAG: energy-coupling factor ABC transporter substrate-binding protein [Acetobacterium sp.]